MLFHVEKCKVMHFGFNNTKDKYEMDGKEIVDVREEKDLVIVIQDDLWSKQCIKVSNSGNKYWV